MSAPSPAKNVIFIMTDQQRADSFGPARHPCANYPVMEQLARESACFSQAYTAATPCCPSRHTFLTGQHTWRNGDFDNLRFGAPDETTWMSILRDHGYACVSVGKTHMQHAGSLHIPIDPGRSWGQQRGWDHFHPTASPEDETNYYDVAVTRRACETMKTLSRAQPPTQPVAQPFALFVGLHAPHEPYVMPARYLDFLKPENVPLPLSRRPDEYQTKSTVYRQRADLFKKMFGAMTDDAIRQGIAGHHCLLKLADDCLGQLLDCMRSLGLMENTLIIFCSDHGDLLGEHNLFNKAATFYEGETRIPLLMRFPDGRAAGKRLDGFASSIDVMPTLLDALGVKPQITLPGRSLLPMIDRNEPIRQNIVCATSQAMMVRTMTHKFWYNIGTSDGELYDLVADPLELDNLYNNPARRDLRLEMTQLLLHTRLAEDLAASRPTPRDLQLYREALTMREPEVVP